MSSYYREQGYGSKTKVLRRLRYVWVLLFIFVLVAGGLFAYDAYKQFKQGDIPSEASKAETSVIVSDTQLMSSPYFQFQTTKKWKAIANETRGNHFVYRQYNGSLVEQELVIDINNDTTDVLANTRITRVLPVTVNDRGKLTPSGPISPHCKDIIKPATSNLPLMATYKDVKFGCNPQTSNYFAVVGLVGGTNVMSLPRPDGTRATYNITYKNVTAQPTSGDLDNIISAFETR